MGEPSGLSPRMRGNHLIGDWPDVRYGSIPAHAGQPFMLYCRPSASWVYPRACGATPVDLDAVEKATGLSPRMRGNRTTRRRSANITGSIPAHAGQPLTAKSLTLLGYICQTAAEGSILAGCLVASGAPVMSRHGRRSAWVAGRGSQGPGRHWRRCRPMS